MELRRADKIAEDLQKQVFDGTYKNGDRLDEVRLAAEFGVSRTPVREALQLLVASGMAEQKPRRGVFVRQPGPVELMEMFETMAEIEAACGRLAAMRISHADLARVMVANDACRISAKANDTDRYCTENEVFHQAIYRGATNTFLEEQALALQSRLRPYQKMQLQFRGRIEQSLTQHEQIIQALQNADPNAAADALRDHVAMQGEKFHQLVAHLKA